MKFSKKLLERQFSLGMILYYCIKHTNHHTVSPIIAMFDAKGQVTGMIMPMTCSCGILWCHKHRG